MTVESTLDQIAGTLYTTLNTQRHSYDIAREAVSRGIPGDIVECGIAACGNFATMIVGALSAGGDDRRFWGFDSFQGIQLAGPRDLSQPGIGSISHNVHVPEEELLVSSGVTVHSREAAIESLKNWGLWGRVQIELVEGWVQHTLPVHAERIERIAILRLDMDLYAPTKCALEWLAPKVVSGGTIIIDDWDLSGPRAAFVEYCEAAGLDWQAMQIPAYEGEYNQGYFVLP